MNPFFAESVKNLRAEPVIDFFDLLLKKTLCQLDQRWIFLMFAKEDPVPAGRKTLCQWGPYVREVPAAFISVHQLLPQYFSSKHLSLSQVLFLLPVVDIVLIA